MTTTTLGDAVIATPQSPAAHGHELVREPALPDPRGAGGERVDGVEHAAVKPRRDDERQRHGRRDELLHAEPGIAEERREAPLREETEVRAVEDAAIRVVPAPEGEREAHPEMRDVRHRYDHPPVGRERPVERHQDGQRIVQVLQHIPVDDRVEEALEPRRRLVEVGDDHLVASPPRLGGLRRVALERRHLPALSREELREKAVRRPDVERPTAPPFTQPGEDDGVARVRIRLE